MCRTRILGLSRTSQVDKWIRSSLTWFLISILRRFAATSRIFNQTVCLNTMSKFKKLKYISPLSSKIRCSWSSEMATSYFWGPGYLGRCKTLIVSKFNNWFMKSRKFLTRSLSIYFLCCHSQRCSSESKWAMIKTRIKCFCIINWHRNRKFNTVCILDSWFPNSRNRCHSTWII